jgi:hypothetical protein
MDVTGNSGLQARPTVNVGEETFTLSSVIGWFDTLLASLDCYNWTFGHGLLEPVSVIGQLLTLLHR